MPRPRRLLLFATVAVAVALAVAICLLWPRPGITRANFAIIEPGMERADVETILDGPARNESTGPTRIEGEVPKSLQPDEFGGFDQDIEVWDKNGKVVFSRPTWQSSHLMILVDFNAEGRVIDKHCVRLRPRGEETISEMLRRWLRL
jgi:hypothetical protein